MHAVDGQGIALARTALAAWDLICGRLARPFSDASRLSRTYWIVCPKARRPTFPRSKLFQDWLLAESRRMTTGICKSSGTKAA